MKWCWMSRRSSSREASTDKDNGKGSYASYHQDGYNDGDISVVGSEKQSEDLVASLKEEMENSPNGIWDTNIFGKSLYEMVAEQMEDEDSRRSG